MQIKDLLKDVRGKLRGRLDLDQRILGWLHDAILDFTQSYSFEELGVKGPLSNFITGQAEYPIDYFLNANAAAGQKFTRILSWFRYFTPTVIKGSSTGSLIEGRAIQVVESMSVINGLPIYYAQNGVILVVGFMPDQAYATYMRWQRQHTFESDLGSTVIRMPDDWRELLVYSAAIRGCDEVGMNEVGLGYYKKLHGDPKEPGNLGLLEVRQSQQRRNLTNNVRSLQPVVRRSCR